MTTVLIDYDSGNLHSAEKAFQRMARETGQGAVRVSNRPEDVVTASRIVLPGDGAFPACRRGLAAIDGLEEAIVEAVTKRAIPFLGICVGMQMLANEGHEYETVTGFGWVASDVRKITPNDPALKVPHMGWNDLVINQPHPVLEGIVTGAHAYFVHSYHMEMRDPAHRLAHCDYGSSVTAIVGHANVIGTQFHPEKSQEAGLRLIANFLNWAP